MKVYLNILKASEGLYTKVFYIIVWMFIGILILVCFIIYDVINLTKILCMHNGCQQYNNIEKAEAVHNTKLKVHVYNQLRNTIETMYKDARAKVSSRTFTGLILLLLTLL